jgi:hypothetical protein
MATAEDISTNLKDRPAATAAAIHSGKLAGWLAGLTIGDGLYAVVVAAAAVNRLVELGRLPLSPGEAASAWSVWQFWQAGSEPLSIASPAYFSMTALLSQVLGYSDGVMRLVPALFGLGIVVLPWFLRQQLGKIGAIFFALSLAISPLNSAISRIAGGDAIALFAALLAAVAWIRWRETGQPGWLYTFCSALGLGLASSPLFYGAILGLVLAWLAITLIGSFFRGEGDSLQRDANLWRKATLFGGATFAATSTMFFWRPAGLASAASLPADWLAEFSLRAGTHGLLDPLLALARYETLLLLTGIVAIVWFYWRSAPLGALGTYWLMVSAILIFLQPGRKENALLLALPGYLLMALLAREVMQRRLDRVSYGLAGSILVGGGLTLVNLGQYSRVLLYDPQQLAPLWTSFLVVAILIFVVYFAGTWQRASTLQGLFLGVAGLSLFYQWGNAWWLGHEAANDPRERWVSLGTDDDVPLMAGVIKGISRQVTGTDFGMDMFSTVDTPVLRWYLREFTELRFGATLPSNARHSVIISPVENDPGLVGQYSGADFGLVRDGVQILQSANPNPVIDTLRWWLFHDSASTISDEKLTLWWRADLAQGLD